MNKINSEGEETEVKGTGNIFFSRIKKSVLQSKEKKSANLGTESIPFWVISIFC